MTKKLEGLAIVTDAEAVDAGWSNADWTIVDLSDCQTWPKAQVETCSLLFQVWQQPGS